MYMWLCMYVCLYVCSLYTSSIQKKISKLGRVLEYRRSLERTCHTLAISALAYITN